MIAINVLNRCWQSLLVGSVAFVGVLSGGINKPIFAQVTPDDTLGAESSVVTPDVTIREILSDKIDGGAIRGANLFHSFSEFNVGEGRGVYFANPDGIENILSRVTGGNASQILGKLGVLGDANLFLLNPNGILFGENASLDIQGSFVASTASGIELGEDGYFSATQPQSSRLLAVSPGALFYNAVAASGGSITNVGNLAVGQGEFLTLAGGTVTSTGSLTAPGGTIQVLGERVGLLENARIDVSSETGGGTVLIGGGFQGQGNIPKAERTFVGSGVTINADAFKSGNGGNVIVWADEVTGFYGNISARGGIEAGNGGFVEVSGKEHLIFRGTVDTSAVNGLWGTLLLDPTNIVIANGSRDSGRDGRNTFAGNNSRVAGSILSAPLSLINDTAPTTIYESELEGLAGNTNVILQATNNITVNNLADNALTFAPGSGRIAFTADADGNGVGAFVMQDVADTLYTNGRDIGINGASLTLGNINTFEWGKLIATVNVEAGGPIPETGTRGTATFTFTVPNLGQRVGNLDVRFSASHTRNTDLDVFLTSPRGTKLGLFTDVGGSGDNFPDTLLDDEARTSINQGPGSAPFNGTFKPEGAKGLAVFQGENPRGIWKLSVTDDQQGNSGTLFRAGETAPWGRAIGTQLLFRTPTTRVSGSIHLNATNGSISVRNLDTSNDFNAGGAISLDASDSITTGIINSSSSVDGGVISLRAGGDITTNGSLSSQSAKGVNLSALTLPFDRSFSSGNGGGISLSSVSGNITTNGYLSSSSLGRNGGAISLSSVSGNITTNGYLWSHSSRGNGGNGGTISLSSISGDITTNRDLNSDSRSGNGGAISLSSISGDITTNGDLNSYSSSGNGGAISLSSISSDITINGDLRSFSYSSSGNSGNGGAISLIARGGNIIGNYPNSLLASFSLSEKGEAGSGGNVTLEAQNQITNLEILTLSSSAQAGEVEIKGFGDLSVTNTRILTSRRVEVKNPFSDETITLQVGGQGQSGDVTVTSSDNLTFNNSSIQSDTNGSGKAGNVRITSPGVVTFNNSQIISNTSNSGNAGSIDINAGGGITFQGLYSYENQPQRGGLFAGTTNQGSAGTITLTTPELTLQNGANIATTTASSANAGNITLQSHPNGQNLNINLAPGTSISASTSNQGTGGNIEINAPNAITIQGQGTLSTETQGRGNAGDIEITSRNLDIQQTQLSTSTAGTGNAGNITLDTSTLTVARGAEIFAFTNGSGNSGTITVNAPTAVNLGIGVEDFSPVLSVETSNGGKAGNIIINTPSLTLSDTARITATATNTATNTEGGGSISLNASDMHLAGVVGVFAETQGLSRAGTLTLKPYQDQSTLNLTLAPQSQVSASTSGSGKGGNLVVTAPEAITIRGQGQLAVQTTGDGAAGDLRIDTQRLTIADGATISASTSSPNRDGAGGNITINATESFNLTNQASLLAQSTGAGRAGDVKINTPQLNLLDQAQVSVETSGAGVAGDVEITTETLTLDRGAKVSATAANTATTSAQGGNVNVNASQINLSGNTSGLFAQTQGAAPAGSLILQPYNNGQSLTVNLKDNPQISASTSGSGKGGNLSVTAPEAVTLRGNGKLSVETTGAGAAGNLTIDTQRLNISDSASISASTSSPNPAGVGGNLTINATQSFNLTNQASLLAQSNGAAKAGNVTINTEQLTANNGSITTSATATSRGEGGSIDVNASEINLKGTEIGLLAETQGVAPAGSLTLQPFNNGRNLTINLQDNAKISAATSGSGQGGSLRVTAPEYITIRGQGQLSVETTGDGAAGNLTIDTQKLTITDGATISASTSSQNPAGVGGNLTINATESFNLTNLAGLLAESTGAAPAGNITINTGLLTANNGSIETSATQSAGGGITITASDIRLFGDSDIRTDVAKGAGGGGNISLTANTIIAFADSDILAYAADGRGGDITFKTPIFFGFAYSPAPKGTDPDTLDHNNRVDINASGAVEGVISLPDLSFIENSLTQLPDNSIDTESLIANSCIVRRYEQQRGSFIITGTGGIPFRPGDAYVMRYQTGTVRSIPNEGDGGETSVARVRAPASLSASQSSPTPQQLTSTTRRLWKMGDPIIEPTGIYRLPNGELIMSRECPQ
jgi:filamentous hemagglutinin family protein